ncbi:hypothetical protein GP486_003316 [Trichoglossum hirsutum]|uniref:Uncharacterized protein n=1 Tax=Trichoglossum hirsutum TaxID=265104 RepID=A0A9P8LD51_9PEZI|nr:hypothetical protein GP486_003316 [Trichoglossum hirsutum]
MQVSQRLLEVPDCGGRCRGPVTEEAGQGEPLDGMALKHPKDYTGSVDEGPAAQISHWIYREGAEITELSTTPEYETVEFATTDIGLILNTLGLFADLITFVFPLQRLIIHGLILLFAYGFRPGMILGMRYRDVVMAVVRDPEDRNRRRLVATFTIRGGRLTKISRPPSHQHCVSAMHPDIPLSLATKLSEDSSNSSEILKAELSCWRNKLRRAASEHKKGKKFQFSTTLLPYPLFCLTHIDGVIGIHCKAFGAGYQSVHGLLYRANLENVDYVALEWHDEMLDDEIFPMSYTSFRRTLRFVLLVAGFSTLARVYTFRVGALVEYDGTYYT